MKIYLSSELAINAGLFIAGVGFGAILEFFIIYGI